MKDLQVIKSRLHDCNKETLDLTNMMINGENVDKKMLIKLTSISLIYKETIEPEIKQSIDNSNTISYIKEAYEVAREYDRFIIRLDILSRMIKSDNE